MSRAYGVAQHDTGKPLIASFSYDNPAIGSLSTLVTMATPVVVIVADRVTGALLVNRAAATVVSSSGGTVVLRYDFTGVQTGVVGRYAATFEAATTGGAVTLPTSGEFIPVTIRADLG
jgi:hypothetical protein